MKAILGVLLVLLLLGSIAFFMTQGRQISGAGGGAQITGVSWRPVRIGDEEIPEDNGMHIRFEVDGSIKGHGGCNSFFGTLQQSDSGIEIGPLGSTRMACPEPIMNRETVFLEAVQKMRDFRTGNGTLSLLDVDGTVLASFVAS